MNFQPNTRTFLRGTETLAQYAVPGDDRFGGLALLGGFVLGNLVANNNNCGGGGCGFGGGGCFGGGCGGGGCMGCGRPRPMAYGYPVAPVQQFQQFQFQGQPFVPQQGFQGQGFVPQQSFVPYQSQGFQQVPYQGYPVYQQVQPIQPVQPVAYQQGGYFSPTASAVSTNKFFIQR